MINQLRKIYSSLLVYVEGIDHLDPNYQWFITDDNEVIGVHENELTSKDLSLLTAFLTPYNIKFPAPTAEEIKWKKIIDSSEEEFESDLTVENRYRFVYFTFNKNQITPVLFKDAIYELFTQKVSILWENEHEGIIIEEQIMGEESTSYEQIIDILMSDLSVNINFFVGPFKESLADVHQHYESMKSAASTVFSYSRNRVVTYIDAVPYLFINQTALDLREDISKTVLQAYIDDEETLKMIETFVLCNLNISETAKVLHMHRNSLQYRLDRFFENTGIDVRQFNQAMTVYLAFLART